MLPVVWLFDLLINLRSNEKLQGWNTVTTKIRKQVLKSAITNFGGKGTSENVLCLPIPDSYRGEFKTENAGLSFSKDAIQKINNLEEKIVAFIAEPIVGCGGQVPLVKNYLKEIYAAIRNQGGVCISDAKMVGNYYLQELGKLQQKYERIGDVRGSGLFIGFEFVKDRLTLIPDTESAQKVKNELRNQYILVGTDGPFENVIKSKPPLCFTKENVDEVIEKLESVLISNAPN